MAEGRGKLDGKVAVVTGAGSSGPGFGTGKAMSVLFAREGAKVVLVDQFEDRARETLELIEGEGGEAAIVAADLADAANLPRVIEQAVARFGGVDILVNNAAMTSPTSLTDTSLELLQKMLAVNLVAPFMLTKAAIPAMIERGGGSVLFVSSIAAMRGQGGKGSAAYAASKSGLHGLMTDIADAYGRHGIRVNCVAPGMVATPMRDGMLVATGRDPEALHAHLVNRTMLGIRGDAWDVAHAALYLCSPDARYITSVLIPVDAGATQRNGG
jgi:NAD(P)-dependent dehydrogenase (short-subunit alcohol dehydrogenase family)